MPLQFTTLETGLFTFVGFLIGLLAMTPKIWNVKNEIIKKYAELKEDYMERDSVNYSKLGTKIEDIQFKILEKIDNFQKEIKDDLGQIASEIKDHIAQDQR